MTLSLFLMALAFRMEIGDTIGDTRNIVEFVNLIVLVSDNLANCGSRNSQLTGCFGHWDTMDKNKPLSNA